MVALHAADAAFVRGPAWLVYRRLTDVARWPSWAPGVTVRRLRPLPGVDERWAVQISAAPLRRLRVAAALHGWRHDLGFRIDLAGDLVGEAELWLEPGHGGTVVRHLIAADTPRRDPGTVLADHRRAVRRGLWGLKDLVQLEVRSSGGLDP